ncbi:histone-like nucleoid-structuring protein Lsr2 [Streptomyces sp. NPDC035033]|uniref:Lsr2 family DNA-binding protein n=1 Tax=Streptomyces sp. NPDC035033 TaxID=3155368 RepID=UPI0033F40048
MTSLEDLTRLVPPPASPPPTDWNVIESLLQTPLPDDYKQLTDTYGPGVFCDFVHLYHPHGATEWVDLTGPMPARLRRQLVADRDSGTCPVPHDPENLFALAVTDNGNRLFWITTPGEEPDAWRIAVDQADGRAWYTHDGNLTSFLVALLSGHVRAPVFPDGLLGNGAFFTPARPADDGPPATPNPAGATTSREVIRQWARSQGYDVPDRGRVPGHVIQAWERAAERFRR